MDLRVKMEHDLTLVSVRGCFPFLARFWDLSGLCSSGEVELFRCESCKLASKSAMQQRASVAPGRDIRACLLAKSIVGTIVPNG